MIIVERKACLKLKARFENIYLRLIPMFSERVC